MSCSCGGACGGGGHGGNGGPPPAWRQTQLDAGVEGQGGQLAQPGRAPGREASGHGFPWWVWLVIALVGYRLLKGGL